MSRLQDIPPDLRAVLSLLLGQRKDYAALAGMLAIEQRAVHDRAHAGLALLAPQQARALTPAQREQVGEYLLGQADPAQRAAALTLLQSSPPAQAWAQALSVELAPLATQPLPEIPAPAAPSSRRGGAILLGGLAVVAIAAVALIVGLSGGGSSTPSATNTSTSSATETSTGTADTSGSSTSDSSTTPSSGKAGSSGSSNSSGGSGTATGETHVEATLPLTPPTPPAKRSGSSRSPPAAAPTPF